MKSIGFMEKLNSITLKNLTSSPMVQFSGSGWAFYKDSILGNGSYRVWLYQISRQ